MRTYTKRFGGSDSGRKTTMFAKIRPEKKKFDFLEFMISDEKVVAPGIAEYIDTLKYSDGSYDFRVKTVLGRSATDIHGTCYAICALKSMGIEPPKGALDYVERLKNDDDGGQPMASATNIPDIDFLEHLKRDRGSFRSGSEKWDGDIENTYWATLALRLGGRSISKESVDYVKSLRNLDGSYGLNKQNSDSAPLIRTRQALTVFQAAGAGLSPQEKEKTAGYILSRLGEDGFGSLDSCYEAVVSLNILGVELRTEERETVKIQVASAKPNSIEKKFKAAAIKRCIGMNAVADTSDESDDEPDSVRDACYMLWLKKLEKYTGDEK